MAEAFGWICVGFLVLMSVGLSIFSMFLISTNPATEEEMFENGSWGQDIDQMAKYRYNSDT